ncbi:MAG TPA: Sec-independent protein translocase protein TatB [Pseudomonas sp.]|nr:Sec-independent protein translocase protein TatB [Pseudomonas sp.]
MFEIGFSELLLVGLVALIVFGPERLPAAARTAGLWVGRLKRSFSAIKAEVEREIGADEIRRQLHNEQILQMERELKQSIMPPLASTSTPEASPAQPEASVPTEPVTTPTAATPANPEPPRQP